MVIVTRVFLEKTLDGGMLKNKKTFPDSITEERFYHFFEPFTLIVQGLSLAPG